MAERINMKKVISLILVLGVVSFTFACAAPQSEAKESTLETPTVEAVAVIVRAEVDPATNEKYAELAKNFYTEYIESVNSFEDNYEQLIKNAKEKYLTDTLIKELELRSNETDADMIIDAQDSVGMLDNMKVEPGTKENTAVVTFDNKYKNGSSSKRVMELHFKDVDGKPMIDELNSVRVETDKNGQVEKFEYKTKYANKEVLTDTDIKEMESLSKYYEEQAAKGYID